MKIYCEGDIGILEHDYTIRDGKMYYSNNFLTKNGELAGSIDDDGNGVKIKIDGYKLKLDYSVARELLILLLYNNEGQIEFREEKVIKII
jgi:hypothetical protein